MMKTKFLALSAGLLFIAAPVLAYEVGTPVECLWKNGSTWYPGVVAMKNGNSVSINYNDGDKELTTTSKCRALGGGAGFGVGTRVRCYWKGGSTLYSGVISMKNGNQVAINYDDGDQELTTVDKCIR